MTAPHGVSVSRTIKKKKITHKIICDRIELGTYLIGGALIAKKLRLVNIDPKLIKKWNKNCPLKKMEKLLGEKRAKDDPINQRHKDSEVWLYIFC